MNRYQFHGPRVVFAMVAIALTAVTIGLSVVLPAQTASAPAPTVATGTIEVVLAAARESLAFRAR
jgi:hypothetical protein